MMFRKIQWRAGVDRDIAGAYQAGEKVLLVSFTSGEIEAVVFRGTDLISFSAREKVSMRLIENPAEEMKKEAQRIAQRDEIYVNTRFAAIAEMDVGSGAGVMSDEDDARLMDVATQISVAIDESGGRLPELRAALHDEGASLSSFDPGSPFRDIGSKPDSGYEDADEDARIADILAEHDHDMVGEDGPPLPSGGFRIRIEGEIDASIYMVAIHAAMAAGPDVEVTSQVIQAWRRLPKGSPYPSSVCVLGVTCDVNLMENVVRALEGSGCTMVRWDRPFRRGGNG